MHNYKAAILCYATVIVTTGHCAAMVDNISSITLNEHRHLIELVDKLMEAIRKLPEDVKWGDTSWAQDVEILNFVRVQMLSLQNAKENVLGGHYRDAYHLLRMVFEAYFVLRLISTCDKYPLRIEIKRGAQDPSIEHARQRILQKVRQTFKDRLITTYMEGKTLVAVLKGKSVVDQKGQDTGVKIPYYYQAWHSFRPVEYHLKRSGLQDRIPTRRFLTGEWASLPRKIKRDLDCDYGSLYKYFLTFDRILENLRLNSILNKKTTTRVLVHYNFFSNFTHSTSDSISIISRRTLTQISSGGLDNIYDHYLSELGLLYVCHLLSMHLQHAIRYLQWRSIGLKHQRKTYESLCRQVNVDFGYFWFIFNDPHEYDRYVHANSKCQYKRRIFFRPQNVRIGDVRYYDDPLHRLKRLHQSQREMLTGNQFISPFPRQDAL